MSLDLVQIRWQQIRLVETSQVLEAENVALRKEIEELKASKAAPAPVVVVQAPAVDTGPDKNKLIKQHCANMTNMLMRTQSELMKLKLFAVKEITGLLQQKVLLSKAFDNLLVAQRIKEAEFEALEYARDQLQIQLDEANQSLQDGKSNSSLEVSKYKLKAKEARTELKESEEQREKLKGLLNALTDKYNALHLSKTEADSNYKVLNLEFQGMQALVDKARSEGEAALAESFNNKLFMQEQYEKIVEELSYENEYLRNTCAEQESQIERLTNSLIGNKSHFARYVEVKTENLTLQSKLQAVSKAGTISAKRPARAEFAGASGGGGIAVTAPGGGSGSGSGKEYNGGAGLPAHQRRSSNSRLAAAGAAAMAPNGSGGGSGGGGGWASAAGSGVRMPSPRDAPVEFSTRSSNGNIVAVRPPFRPSNAPEVPHQQQQYSLNEAHSSPQSSPRFHVGGVRQSSSSSVVSMRSVLVEPTLLPPPVSGIQPRAGPDALQPTEWRGDGSGKGTKKSLRFEQQSSGIAKTVI